MQRSMMAFGRAVVFRSFRQSAIRTRPYRIHERTWQAHRNRRVLHCSALTNSGGDQNSQTTDESQLANIAGQELNSTPQIDTNALLAAFDEALEAEFDAEPEIISRSDAKSKRKAAKAKADTVREQEYLRRLEVLTALPADIEIKAKSNQCPGCGCDLQSVEPESPGYLPKLNMRNASRKSTLDYVGPDDMPVNPDEVAKLDEEKKPIICQRCYKLSHYGSIAETLRVKPVVADANVEKPLVFHTGPVTSRGRTVLSATRFRKSLEALRTKSAIIVYLVDIFDFHGTFLTSLKDIIGSRNPILLAINKIDLLPKDFKANRVEKWVLSECESMGLQQVAAVHLVSSTKGTGVANLLSDAVRMGKKKKCDIYVIGAANVGKSSFINKVVSLRKNYSEKEKRSSRDGRGRRTSAKGTSLTTSVIPGTTLDSIRIPLGQDINLYDTPGVIVNHQLTNRLTTDELSAVLPSKNMACVTYRLGEGKALYLGGLARIDVLDGKPFFFTVFISPNVKVHPGKIEGATEFLEKHTGGLLKPPFNADRLVEMGEWTSKTFTAAGDGWRRASVDIVLSGLGWVSITGVGNVKLRVNAPYGIGVFTREALMPFEARAGVSKYTGSRGLNRRQEKAGKRKQGSDIYSSIDDWN